MERVLMLECTTDSRDPDTHDEMIRSLVQQGRAAWETVFEDLYPVAHDVIRMILPGNLEAEVEDVALEALEALVGQVGRLKSSQELRPLVIRISRNKAIDRLKYFLAQKRMRSIELSIDSFAETGIELSDGRNQFSIVDELSIRGLKELLNALGVNARTQYWEVLLDVYLCDLSEDDVARKRGISSQSVRKYIQRGLDEIRNSLMSNSVLKEELKDLLNIERTVSDCIPLVFAATKSGRPNLRASLAPKPGCEASEEKLTRNEALPETCYLSNGGKLRLMAVFGVEEAISKDLSSKKKSTLLALISGLVIFVLFLILLFRF